MPGGVAGVAAIIVAPLCRSLINVVNAAWVGSNLAIFMFSDLERYLTNFEGHGHKKPDPNLLGAGSFCLDR